MGEGVEERYTPARLVRGGGTQEDGEYAGIWIGDFDAGTAAGGAGDPDGDGGALAQVVDDVGDQLADAQPYVVGVVAEPVAQFGDGLRGGEEGEYEAHRSADFRRAAASSRAVAVLQFPSATRPGR